MTIELDLKKDIKIPEVTDVSMVIVNEYNDVYKSDDWNVYIINNKAIDIEMVLIVSHGFDGEQSTSKMRHKIEKLPAHSFAKVELIQPELLELNNEFNVSFFADNQLFDKKFVLAKNIAQKKNLSLIKALDKQGVELI